MWLHRPSQVIESENFPLEDSDPQCLLSEIGVSATALCLIPVVSDSLNKAIRYASMKYGLGVFSV